MTIISSMKKLNVFYAGDSPAGGPANYLLGILADMKAKVTHFDPSEVLSPDHFKQKQSVFILSDFSKKNLPKAAESALAQQVENGAGLLMVGGWGSFSGPFGGWKNSRVEKLLPVICKESDDRVNFPGGALIMEDQRLDFLSSKWFQHPPSIAGLNDFEVKPGMKTLLTVRPVLFDKGRVLLSSKRHPFLVVRPNGPRTAALATDLAPHWCGGMVDWGTMRRKLSVTSDIKIEVGNYYIDFVKSLIIWLGS